MGNVIFTPLDLCATVIYPAYQSYKCLEHAEKHDSRQWLTYWLVFSGLYVVDTLLGFVLHWIPLYGTCKFLFMCFCAYVNGATIIYSRYLRPYIASKEEQIDEQIGRGVTFVQSRFKTSMTSGSQGINSEEFMAPLEGDLPDEQL